MVGALGDQRGRLLLAGGRVVERVVAADEHLAVGGVGVHRLGTEGEAVAEAVDERDVESGDRADVAGLAEAAGDDAEQVRVLVLTEHAAVEVVGHVGGAVVDQDEVLLGILGGELLGQVDEVERGEDDDRRCFLDCGFEVGATAVEVGRLVGVRRAAEALGGAFGADRAGLEEHVGADRGRRDVDERRRVVAGRPDRVRRGHHGGGGAEGDQSGCDGLGRPGVLVRIARTYRLSGWCRYRNRTRTVTDWRRTPGLAQASARSLELRGDRDRPRGTP